MQVSCHTTLAQKAGMRMRHSVNYGLDDPENRGSIPGKGKRFHRSSKKSRQTSAPTLPHIEKKGEGCLR